MTAAIYVDGGMEAAKKFVCATLDFDRREFDYISGLQELLQGMGKPLPEYGEAKDNGTPQKHDFTVSVNVQGKVYSGRGRNSAEAKRNAAKAAYDATNNKTR